MDLNLKNLNNNTTTQNESTHIINPTSVTNRAHMINTTVLD